MPKSAVDGTKKCGRGTQKKSYPVKNLLLKIFNAMTERFSMNTLTNFIKGLIILAKLMGKIVFLNKVAIFSSFQ